MRIRVVPGRKLLVASIGVAAVAYVACTSDKQTSGNLVAPPADAAHDAPPTSGNLAPPPFDAGDAGGDASDAADASDAGDAQND